MTNTPSWPRFSDDPIEKAYANLRRECAALEELIEIGPLTEKELKRLDKAVTVMKVGFKIVKKVVRKRQRDNAEPTRLISVA